MGVEHRIFLTYKNIDTALQKYFLYYLKNKKVGLITTITGSQFLKTGTGKSYTALRLGEEIDKNFSINKVVYYPTEFLKVMDNIEKNEKKGQVIVVDEGEITAPASLWYSYTNKAIAYTLATFRYLQCMAIFVTPAFSWLDKKVRILTSHLGFTDKIVTETRDARVLLRLYQIKTDLFGDKIFFSKIRMVQRDTYKLTAFKYFYVNLPSQTLIDEYEKKSTEFKKMLRDGLAKELNKFKKYQGEDKEKETEDIKKYVDEALNNQLIFNELKEKNRVSRILIDGIFFEKLKPQQITVLTKMINLMWKKRQLDD